MRLSTSLFCLAATLVAVPAFAQGTAKPSSLANAKSDQTATEDTGSQFTFGLGLNRGGTERSLLPLAPVAKDQVELSWKPANNWNVTLDLTSRAPNNGLFPREEVTAGLNYQVTPRFRLGGGVTVKGDSLAESLSNPAQNFGREGTEASVRIESAFSF